MAKHEREDGVKNTTELAELLRRRNSLIARLCNNTYKIQRSLNAYFFIDGTVFFFKSFAMHSVTGKVV
jgi:hypothetical protein